MEYQYLTEQNKVTAVQNRLAQLEQEHFTTILYAREAQLLGGDGKEWLTKMGDLETLINDYREQLVPAQPEENEQQNESTANAD